MKAVFMYDTVTRIFKSSKLVDDDYVATAGESEIEPSEGLYEPITFPTDDATAWVGTEQAVWQATQDAAYQKYLKEHPEAEPQPTAEEKQLSELIKVNSQQAVLNAQLIKQLAALQTATTQEAE